MTAKQVSEPVIYNRRARHDYQILETLEAGISLQGPEVKSLRSGNASIAESFGRLDRNEVFLYNMYIAPYACSRAEVDPRRRRRLLLHKREIERISQAVSQRGLTLIPLKVYFRRGWAKTEIAIAKARRKFDKREKLRKRIAEREIRRADFGK